MNTPTTPTPGACVQCGAPFPVHPPGYLAYAGYAVRPDGGHICYPCADAAQREDMRDRSRPFVAYLSGTKVTTWTGGELGTVVWTRPAKLTRPSFTHDRRSYRSVRVRDVHGAMWTGRGSDGIAIRLRPVK